MSPSDGAPGDEARALIAAVQQWTQQWAQRNLPAPPSGHPGPECQWCPLCQLASVLRGEYPELAARLTEAGGAIVDALAAVGGAAGRARPRPGPAATPEQEAGAPTAERVQHITIADRREPDSPG